MEPDMASTMVQKVTDDGYNVGTIHADNDSTTTARLKVKFKSLEKKDDKNHVKKNLSKHLYGLSKNHKALKSAGVIPYIVRCFMYAICSNKASKLELEQELKRIVPHIFGDHSQCSSSQWCKYQNDPENYK